MQKENPYGSQDFGLRWKGRFVDGGKPHCIYIFRLPTWPTLLKRPLSGKRERKKKKGRRMQMSNPTEGVGNGQLSTGSYYILSLPQFLLTLRMPHSQFFLRPLFFPRLAVR